MPADNEDFDKALPSAYPETNDDVERSARNEAEMRAGRYLQMGRDYVAAVQMLADHPDGTRAVNAFWAMTSHGLELSLKAFLRAGGCSEDRLMMINHSLDHCFDVCRRLEAEWDPELVTLLEALDAAHASQSFRYPGWRVDFDTLPSPAHAARTLVLHLDRIAAYIETRSGHPPSSAIS